MTWTIDGHKVADCEYDNCKITGTDYEFSFDTKNGIFNITMNPVLYADNGRIFKCDDGTNLSLFNAEVFGMK